MTISISRREWLIALVIAAAVVAVLTIPYWLGYGLARPGMVYNGLVMNAEDSQSYFAKMLQGYDGHWLYTIPFTPEPHQPAFLGGFYLALGHLARWLAVPLAFIWHASRAIAGLILFMTTFSFVATFLPQGDMRWTAYLLSVLGSGLGWLLFALNQTEWLGAFPVDFKMPEAHLFFTGLTFPHVALGTALIMLSFWLILRGFQGGRKAWLFGLMAGLTNLLLGIVYPFLIYLIVATVGLYWLFLCLRVKEILWSRAGVAILAFILPAPLFLYYAYIQQVNEVFRAWADQATTLSPPWPHYLVAFGLLFLLALLPVIRRNKPHGEADTAFLWAWIICAALLLYAPLNPQRRYVQGLQVPLSILATMGIFQVVLPWVEGSRLFRWLVARPRYSDRGLRNFLLFAFLVFMSLSNLYLLADVSFTAGFRQPYPFFRSRDEVVAVDWLRANSDRSAVVMAAYQTGNFLAARAGNPVVLGHWAETMHWTDRMVDAQRFYSAQTMDSWRRDFLRQQNVKYVWYGPQERFLGDFSPGEVDYLTPVYQVGESAIFAVR